MGDVPDLTLNQSYAASFSVPDTISFALPISAFLKTVRRWRMQRSALRRQLLNLFYCEFLPAPQAKQRCALHALCTGLLDYASTGHFEVYELLLRQQQRPDAETILLLGYLMRSIGNSTDALLRFNDRYAYWPDTGNPAGVSVRLYEDIRKLSRNLLLRFVLEEQLLELVCNTKETGKP